MYYNTALFGSLIPCIKYEIQLVKTIVHSVSTYNSYPSITTIWEFLVNYNCLVQHLSYAKSILKANILRSEINLSPQNIWGPTIYWFCFLFFFLGGGVKKLFSIIIILYKILLSPTIALFWGSKLFLVQKYFWD